MMNYTGIKNKDLKLNTIDNTIYKNFSLHTFYDDIDCQSDSHLSNNEIEHMEAEIVITDSDFIPANGIYNYEVLYDYEFRSKEVDDKLLKLRNNLIERTNSSKKGFFSYLKSKLFK